ncbi:hypothetical protein H5991_06020 [Ligilactobacillus agilis]|uniref:hypothetical protein n=1 Tax=Ligilactobacillus agilis TaxID=1601 RepID=UPI00195CABA2|nr:hypothetical protein [Ligilactobacillus agilis]MBM6773057.1 hypothetical protein [Ligilactobacillus agilis]
MLFAKKVTNQLEQEEIYRQRYKIFVERDKDAPKELYPNGLLKDAIDNDAIHIGCELIKRTATIIIFANSNQQSIKLIENLSLDGEE